MAHWSQFYLILWNENSPKKELFSFELLLFWKYQKYFLILITKSSLLIAKILLEHTIQHWISHNRLLCLLILLNKIHRRRNNTFIWDKNRALTEKHRDSCVSNVYSRFIVWAVANQNTMTLRSMDTIEQHALAFQQFARCMIDNR